MQTYQVSNKKYFNVESAKHIFMIQWFNLKTVCVDCGFAIRYVLQNDINKVLSFSAKKV